MSEEIIVRSGDCERAHATPEGRERWKKLLEWMRSNGIDPYRIPWDAELVLVHGDVQKLRYPAHDFTAIGPGVRRYAQDPATGDVLVTETETELSVPFPGEW